MTPLGDQTDSETQSPTRTPPTTGMTRVMDTSATPVEVTDATFAVDTDTSTPTLSGENTDTTSRRDSVLDITTPTSVTRSDHHITSTDT